MKLYYSKKYEDLLFPIQYMSIPIDLIECEKDISLEIGTEIIKGERCVLMKVKELCRDPHDNIILNDTTIDDIIMLREKKLLKIFPLFLSKDSKEGIKDEIISNIELEHYYNSKHLTFVDLYLFARTYKVLRENGEIGDEALSWFRCFQEEITKSLKIEKIEVGNFFDLEIRCGKINNISDHDESDRLYVEEVNTTCKIQVVSGLRDVVSKKELLGNSYLFLTNLKPVKLRNKISNGMILCAKDIESGIIEPLQCRESEGSLAHLEKMGFEVIPNLKPIIYKSNNKRMAAALQCLRIKDHKLYFKKSIVLLNGKEIITKTVKNGTVS